MMSIGASTAMLSEHSRSNERKDKTIAIRNLIVSFLSARKRGSVEHGKQLVAASLDDGPRTILTGFLRLAIAMVSQADLSPS